MVYGSKTTERIMDLSDEKTPIAIQLVGNNPKHMALAAKKAPFKVKWNKASGATGYQIQYSASKYFVSSKTVTVKGATTLSKTVKKLKSGKKYYVRVRSLKKSGKKTYYSSWSKEKAVKTK